MQPEPEPEEEEEEEGGEEDGEDDEGEDEEEGEDEGELVFSSDATAAAAASASSPLRGTLTYSSSGRVHYRGEVNSEHEPHGTGELLFPDGSSLRGSFAEGVPSGVATYSAADGSRIVGPYVDGVQCGEVVEYDDEGAECFRGQYVDGVRHGDGAVTLPDGGRLVGRFVQGVFDGANNRYVYPPALDTEVSLRGLWSEGEMKRAQFYLGDKPATPAQGGGVDFAHDESTATRISTHPLLADPFESLTVFVEQSTIPHSGEGLFARVALPAGVVVTFYSGTRDKGYKSERRRWSENSNTIALIDDDPAQADVDIDVGECWATTATYRASLAHKVNHTFPEGQRNAKYDMCLHPRFGLIKCVRTTKPVPAGGELFVDYGYTLTFDAKGNVKGNAGPLWYRKGFAANQKRMREQGGDEAQAEEAAAANSSAASSSAAALAKETPAAATASSKQTAGASAAKRRKR